MRISANVEFTAEDIVDQCNRQSMLKLIKDIDALVAEWSFTLKLCEHFDALRKQHEMEVATEGKAVG